MRHALESTVARRDAEALTDLADGGVVLDFGGGEGRDELIRRMQGEGGEALWGELAGVLSAGCSLDGGIATLPWIAAQDFGDADPTATMLVAGERIPVLAHPDHRARHTGILSWQLAVIRGEFDPAAEFQPVAVIGSGIEGYLPTAILRNVYGYRLLAERRGTEWRITAFVAGD